MMTSATTYAYNTKSGPKTYTGEFRRWTISKDGGLFAVFAGAKTPLTVSESNLPPETLAQLPPRPIHIEPDGSETEYTVEHKYGLAQGGDWLAVRFEQQRQDAIKRREVQRRMKNASRLRANLRVGREIRLDQFYRVLGGQRRNRTEVFKRRNVWPLGYWDKKDITLALWADGTLMLCEGDQAHEVKALGDTLKLIYDIHFGGRHGQ